MSEILSHAKTPTRDGYKDVERYKAKRRAIAKRYREANLEVCRERGRKEFRGAAPRLSDSELTDAARKLFRYNPETGQFVRVSTGKVTGTIDRGYIKLQIARRFYMAHRVAWLLTKGAIPDGLVVDHINRSPNDNRLSNLRLATQGENSRNRGHQRNNTTGFRGIYKSVTEGRWCAAIRTGGRERYLGTFATKIEAARAYDHAALQAYGEFAVTNVTLGLLPPCEAGGE